MATILVVDDEPIIRKLVCSMVATAGHQHLSASNGLEALAVFRSNASAIDLVITDIRMPVMDGTEAIVRMRETRPDLRVICMSGYADEPIPHGAHLIQKPFSAPELRALIDRVLHP